MTLRSQEGTVEGIALGFREQSHRRLLAPFTRRLWFDTMPAVAEGDRERLEEFLRQLEAYARGSGITVLDVGSYACPGTRESLEKLGFRVTRRLEFELSLSATEEDLWQGMEYKRRKNIKKGDRMGVIVRDLPGDDGVTALRQLQGESSKRIVARGGGNITYKGEPGRDPVRVLLDAGLGRMVVAESEGKIVSAGLFTCFNGLVYHTLSGHSEEGLRCQAPTFLLWKTINRYRTEGARRFNFGGCSITALDEGSPEHGVYAYKKDFGGECIECASGRKVLRRTMHGVMNFARALARRT